MRSISFPPYHDKHSACAATCSKPSKLTLLTSPQVHLEFCCHPMLDWRPGFLGTLHGMVRFALETPDELLQHSWSQVLWTQLNAPFQVTSKMALLCGQEPKALWIGYHHHSQSWSLSEGKLAELWRNLIIWGTWPMRGKWSCTIQLSESNAPSKSSTFKLTPQASSSVHSSLSLAHHKSNVSLQCSPLKIGRLFQCQHFP